mgnify:CR=1 FL=1
MSEVEPPRWRHALLAAVALAYALALPALAYTGVSLWTLYCEGFGCIGTGIAWAMWAAGYAIALLLGVLAWRLWRGPGARLLGPALVLQLAAGAALAAWWAIVGT